MLACANHGLVLVQRFQMGRCENQGGQIWRLYLGVTGWSWWGNVTEKWAKKINRNSSGKTYQNYLHYKRICLEAGRGSEGTCICRLSPRVPQSKLVACPCLSKWGTWLKNDASNNMFQAMSNEGRMLSPSAGLSPFCSPAPCLKKFSKSFIVHGSLHWDAAKYYYVSLHTLILGLCSGMTPGKTQNLVFPIIPMYSRGSWFWTRMNYELTNSSHKTWRLWELRLNPNRVIW